MHWETLELPAPFPLAQYHHRVESEFSGRHPLHDPQALVLNPAPLLPLPRYLCFPAPGPFASAGSPPPAKQNARQPAVAGEAGHLVLALPRRLLEPRVGARLAASSMHRVPLAAMGECRTLLQMPQHPPSQIRVALGAEASEVGRGWAGS